MNKVIQFFSNLQPFMSFIGALFSITVLGFIIRLHLFSKSVRSEQIKAIEEQKKIIEERLKNSEADLVRTEKWYEKELTELQQKLSELMESQNINLEKLFFSNIITTIENDLKNKIDKILSEMNNLEDKIAKSRTIKINDPKWYLEMAKGYTATNNWLQAAEHYGEYLKINPTEWEVYFYQGVAYQNSRNGKDTDFKALISYSNAINWIPETINYNTKSRIFTYKGASLKRLMRLDESEACLLLGQKYATEEYEIYDNKYNLACVYAMMNDRKKLFVKLAELAERSNYLQLVKAHKNDYFKNFSRDPDFLEFFRL